MTTKIYYKIINISNFTYSTKLIKKKLKYDIILTFRNCKKVDYNSYVC